MNFCAFLAENFHKQRLFKFEKRSIYFFVVPKHQ